MWLSFARPEYLLLLPLVLWLLWRAAGVSYADLRGRRRTAAWAVRIAILVCLLLAVAGAQFVRRSKHSMVVFALDASASVPESERKRALDFIKESLKHRRAGDRAALVVFGHDAVVESESLTGPDNVQITSTPATTHTDIASALRLSLGVLSPEASGRIVLLSDGNENVGSAAQETLLAQANKVPVEVVPLQTRSARDVVVREVSIPAHARRGEPFPLRATIEATQPTDAVLTVLADDKPIVRRAVTLAAGRSSLRIPVALQDTGFTKLDVLVESKAEECRENDRGTGFVRIKAKPRVLVVAANPTEAADLARGLSTQDIEVTVGGGAQLPTNVADLDKYDSVMLVNYPAYGMTERQMTMLRDATRDLGIGLGMVGGEYSFGAGGYYRSPIEEALPVTMDLKKDRSFPASAILIIIDTSGSMGMIEDGVEKIQLAAESACTTVDLLQAYDTVGVMASDPAPTMVAELHRVENKARIKSDIRSLRAGGGGIYCFPSLSLAYDAMRKLNVPVRHVIMLADGGDCDEPNGCVELAALMSREKISVTTIAFGNGKDVPFLKQVAAAGRGNFYLTDKARDLKKIFTRETLTIAKNVLVEERFQPRLAETTEVIEGVDWGATPPLLGYVATSPKGLAHVPLVSHKDDPLLAHWQYGLGKSIAFTSDATAHWAAHWLSWPEYPKFWSQTVRWSLRQESSGALHPTVESSGDRAHVVVDATTESGAYLDGLELTAHVNQPDGGRAEVPLTQTGPGRYEVTVPAPASGSYMVGLEASGAGGFRAQQTFGFAIPYPPDLADTKQNAPFLTGLAEQTGGKLLTKPEEVFAPPTVTPRVPVDIWRGLLWLAALLLPLDVAIRRLIIQREDLAPFLELASALRRRFHLRRAPAVQPGTDLTGRLLEVKRAARPQREQEELPEVTLPTPGPRESGIGDRESEVGEPTAGAAPGEATTSRLLKKKRERRT